MLRINLSSSQSGNVASDLAKVAGADSPKISLNAAGEILFGAAPTDMPGGYLIANLSVDPVLRVTINGENGKTVVVVGDPGGVNPPGTPTQPLCATGMYFTRPGKSSGIPPPTVDIDLVYDPAGLGGPYRGYDPSGTEIPMPGPAQLVFLLAAAAHWYLYSYRSGPDPSTVIVDLPACLKVENNFRLGNFMPERAGALDIFGTACPVKPHKHASSPPAKTSTTHFYTLPKCFVATAAYGSPLDDRVDFLRRFREDVLIQTRAGHDFFQRFHERYYQISPAIAARMNADSELAALMRQAIVEPLIQWLRLALELPDADLEDVPAPWAGFLDGLQSTLEEWAEEVVEPWGVEGLEGIEGVRELAIILRFVMRKQESRAAYLSDLETRKVIPLRIAEEDMAAARRILVDSGRTELEMSRVLGSVAVVQPKPSQRGEA